MDAGAPPAPAPFAPLVAQPTIRIVLGCHTEGHFLAYKQPGAGTAQGTVAAQARLGQGAMALATVC